MTKAREKKILWGVLAYILLFGIVYSCYLGSHFRFIDGKEYYTIARNTVLTGQRSLDGIHPSAYHCPGYTFFLSVFIFLGANIVCLRFLNFIALALSVYLLYRILQEEAPGRAGLIGALLVVCYPVLFYTAGLLYPQTIAGTLLLGIVYLGRFPQRLGKGTPWLIGLLFGALIFFVPALVLLLVPFLGWVWFDGRAAKRDGRGPGGPSAQDAPAMTKTRRDIMIILVVALGLVGLWTLRNYLIFRRFIFVNSNSGIVLLLGNSEHVTPNGGTNVDISRYVSEANRLKMNEIDRDRYYRQQALKFMRENPARTLELYGLKFLNYFNYRNELGTRTEAARWKDVVMFFTWGPLLVLFLARLLLAGQFRVNRFEGLLILLYFSGAFIHALFYTRIRYHLPFDFLLIMVVAMFLNNYVLKFRNN